MEGGMSQCCGAGASVHEAILHKSRWSKPKWPRKLSGSVTVQNSICLLFTPSLRAPPGADHLLPNTLVTAFK